MASDYPFNASKDDDVAALQLRLDAAKRAQQEREQNTPVRDGNTPAEARLTAESNFVQPLVAPDSPAPAEQPSGKNAPKLGTMVKYHISPDDSTLALVLDDYGDNANGRVSLVAFPHVGSTGTGTQANLTVYHDVDSGDKPGQFEEL